MLVNWNGGPDVQDIPDELIPEETCDSCLHRRGLRACSVKGKRCENCDSYDWDGILVEKD